MYMKWKHERGDSPASTPQPDSGKIYSKSFEPLRPSSTGLNDSDGDTEEEHVRLVPEFQISAIYNIQNDFNELKLRKLTDEEVEAVQKTDRSTQEGESNKSRMSISLDNVVKGISDTQLNILKGTTQEIPPPRSKVVRVFLSSTFSDMKAERNALHRSAHPKVQEFCQKLSLEYQVVDMRWGVTDDAVNEHLTSQICLREIKNCQRFSMGPNFVTLLGNRYGYRPLQVVIPEREFNVLIDLIEKNSQKALIFEWYKKDCNADPAVYVLQPIASILKHYNDTREQHFDLRKTAQKKWNSVSADLHHTLISAAAKAVKQGKMLPSRLDEYTRSVTEEEIHNGLLSNSEASKQCVAFHRSLRDYESYMDKDQQVQRYVDVRDDNGKSVIDNDLQLRLSTLANDSIPRAIGGTNCVRYEVQWTEGGVTLEDQAHEAYLVRFCKDYVENLCTMIQKEFQTQTDISKEMDSAFLSVMEEVERHGRFCWYKCSTFCGQDKILNHVKEYTREEYGLPLIIHGESGVGKTSIIAMVAHLLLAWSPDCNIIVRFLGTTKSSSTIISLLQSISLQICYLYNIDPPSAADVETFSSVSRFFNALLSLIGNGSSNKPLTLILDSLDQLSPNNGAHILTWLPRCLSPKVHIIVSTIAKGYGILNRLLLDPVMVRTDSFIEVEGLDSAAGKDVLKMRLTQNKRKVTTEQEEMLKAAFAQCQQALYIKLAIDMALSWQSYCIVKDTDISSTVQEAIIHLFLDLENKHGTEPVRFALGYITVSKEGLSELELEDVLSCNDQVLNNAYQYHNPPLEGVIRIPPLLWARISYDLDEYLTERETDGKATVFWYHRQFQEVAKVKFVDKAHVNIPNGAECCIGFVSHGHRLHSDLAKVFSAEVSIRETIHLSKRKLTIQDADRCVAKQPRNKDNLRWLNALPYHLMQPEFHSDDSCFKLRQLTLCNFQWLLAKLEAEGPSEALNEFIRVIESCKCKHEELNITRDFLVLAEPAVRYRTNLLAVEIVARLPKLPKLSNYPNIKQMICEASEWLSTFEDPIIYPIQPCLPEPNGLLKARIVGPQQLVSLPAAESFVVGSGEFFGIRLGVWSRKTNELLHILEAPPGCAYPIDTKVNHKGSVLVTVQDTKTASGNKEKGDIILRVYNPLEGTLTQRFVVAKEDKCISLDLSLDGRLVVIASAKGVIYLVDLQKQRIGKLPSQSRSVKNVRMSLDGDYLASSHGKHVTIWKIPGLQQLHDIIIPSAAHRDVFFMARNKATLSAICGFNIVLILQADTGDARFITCESPQEHLTCLATSWDGEVTAAGGSDGHVWVINSRSDTVCSPSFKVIGVGHKGIQRNRHMAISWDGQFVMAGTNGGQIHIWHIPSLTNVKIIYAHATGINELVLSADHESLFSSAPDLYIKEWRVGRILRQFLRSQETGTKKQESSSTGNYQDLHLSQDGLLAILEPTIGAPEVWDVHTGEQQHNLVDPYMHGSSVVHQISVSGEIVFVVSATEEDGGMVLSIHVWDISSKKLVASETNISTGIAKISPDSSAVFIAEVKGTDLVVKRWCCRTLRFNPEISVTTAVLEPLEFLIVTSDNKHVVVVSLCSTKTKKAGVAILRQMQAVDLKNQEVTFSPPTISGEGKAKMAQIKVGDTACGVILPSGANHKSYIKSFTGNKYLVATCASTVWEVDAKSQTVCYIYAITFTDSDWKQIKCMLVSDDGQYMAVGSASGRSIVYNLISHQELIRTSSPHNQVWSLALSVDHSILACGYRNNMIEVWDVKEKRLRCDMMAHADVDGLLITPDMGRVVALVDSKVTQRVMFLKLQSLCPKNE